MYDYLIVGSGLFGSTFGYEANKFGKSCLIIDRRPHLAGNIHCEKVEGINVHKYGPHIFHTDDLNTWNYVNRFADFNHYRNSPLAIYEDELYNLPFNMNTFRQIWGVTKPEDARKKIQNEIDLYGFDDPKNLEEQAITLVGKTIYEKLIKGYTEKQWGRPATEIPAFIIKRLPVRFTYDNNYFNHRFQGIPNGGYNRIIENMLDGVEVKLESDYLLDRDFYDSIPKKIGYSGMIDEFFD